MRTTLNIDDALMRKIKRRARERGCTLTQMIEDALRQYVQPRSVEAGGYVFDPEVSQAKPLVGVDFADRDSLYEAMEQGG